MPLKQITINRKQTAEMVRLLGTAIRPIVEAPVNDLESQSDHMVQISLALLMMSVTSMLSGQLQTQQWLPLVSPISTKLFDQMSREIQQALSEHDVARPDDSHQWN